MESPKAPKVSAADDATEVLSQQEILESGDQGLEPGTEIGEYVIEKMIGGGGGGVVYAARHRDGRPVAIKVLRAEMAIFPAMVTRFVREAAAVNTIRHPNIIQIYDFGEIEPGRPYYTMELLDGMDLRHLIQLHGRFSPRETLELLDPVCQAVQAAHEAGIIHRDIKANNVLIADVQGHRLVKLLDFGIAKMLHGEHSGQGLTEPGARIGTAHNMAPEQVRCERLDGRADIYALGVLAYQLLTGHYPFHADDPRQIALLHLTAPAPRPSASAPVSPAIDAVVLRCLEKHPDRRYATVTELLAALRAAVGDAPAETSDAPSQAFGVYLEIGGGEDDGDDAVFEDISNVLDLVENGLASRSFCFPLRTSNALLGVRVIANDADADGQRAELESAVAELKAIVEERPDRHPGVRVALSCAVGEALCRASTTGIEVVGGPLLEVATWTEQGVAAG